MKCEKGWLDRVLDEAHKRVLSWPEWMQSPEMRYAVPKQTTSDEHHRRMLIPRGMKKAWLEYKAANGDREGLSLASFVAGWNARAYSEAKGAK